MSPPLPSVFAANAPDHVSMRQVPGRGIFYTRDTQWFIHSTGLVTVGAGLTVPNVQINITADAAFQVTKVVAALYGPANAILTNEFELDGILLDVRITDNSRVVTEVAVPLSSYAGNARLPFVLPYPLVISPNSTISHTFTSLAAAERRVRLQYVGLKHFDLRKQDIGID